MKLIIFDIDGTILDSVNADDKCFIQTFKTLYQIDLSTANWNDFTNVTDSGLTMEIFENRLNRTPLPEELTTIKSHFKNLLSEHVGQFSEIDHAFSFIQILSENPEFEIGFATGGWKETAELKCNSVGFNLNDFIFKSSNDHYNRAKIIELVIEAALDKNEISEFESITYFGDGLWDFKTTAELGINFIGVDFKNNEKLKNAGVEKIIKNFSTPEMLLNWLTYHKNQ